ncbi:helix-turn-helix domain-containing protein [Porcipelethomonas ammoniilytica]|uniref:helix-turn-helix domain-containing protein n=1 Tax=Porcipelethomonas ammoniilytica TaxID=2981722 RepID=UPI0008202D36|nr:helix-turn-helix transcriptional regulator [Porcipelethomonas ammoniilytica]MCU6720680.1 helix-turn-helix domain-containing protein [Porcipelethomonas ammoniilytica]SCJ21414.1 Predicted transcriptional regulator [uncultured Ruminococcus sp.]
MAIGKILSDVLKERNTTVTDLARNINVAPTTIYSIIERDNMKIDISVLIKICKSLDVDIEMFYKDYLDNNDSDKTVSEIMFKYNQLNDDGKAKLNERLDELLELPKYRK